MSLLLLANSTSFFIAWTLVYFCNYFFNFKSSNWKKKRKKKKPMHSFLLLVLKPSLHTHLKEPIRLRHLWFHEQLSICCWHSSISFEMNEWTLFIIIIIVNKALYNTHAYDAISTESTHALTCKASLRVDTHCLSTAVISFQVTFVYVWINEYKKKWFWHY